MESKKTIRVGISTCLLGENVRYDGGHKRDRYMTDVLSDYFDWEIICPELEVGMGVPREAVRLVDNVASPRMVGIQTQTDWTKRMNDFSEKKIEQLRKKNLCGYIFKSDSPSCGIERVKVYAGKESPNKNGRGLFADAFMKAFPSIPVEEEGRLNDAKLRENFIVRVFAYSRLQELFSSFSRKALVQFHSEHKFLLLAHSPKHYTQLGQLVAKVGSYSVKEFQQQYSALFMEALKIKTTSKKNMNVLQHIFGYISDKLSSEEKNDILSTLNDYHRELIPLIVPTTLLSHYAKKLNIKYICEQVYLSPHPKELMLRNHV